MVPCEGPFYLRKVKTITNARSIPGFRKGVIQGYYRKMPMQGSYYHIYNRGVNRGDIFYKESDYFFCLKRVSNYCKKYSVQVIAYCLMPNHYHFLIRQDGEVPVSRWIQTVFNGYAQAFNKENNRKGTLFESRCQIKLIDKEAWLLHLVRYIHLNPVQAGLVFDAKDWPYSNYLEWIGERNGSLVDRDFIKRSFDSANVYIDFVREFQKIRDEQKISKFLFKE